MVDGHKDSGRRFPATFLEAKSISVDVSCTGVDGDELGGDDGVEGRFLSADTALFGTDAVAVAAVLVTVGEGQRLGPEDKTGVGDLYLELTSLVLDRRVVPSFLSAGSNGGLGVSTFEYFCNACCDSHTSIQTIQIRPY